MKDLMTPVRPSVLGVIMSIWFFCTVWKKDLMLGLMACRVETGGEPSQARVISEQCHSTLMGLTLWLFLGGENLFVGLSSAVSGALRLVLRLDLHKSSRVAESHCWHEGSKQINKNNGL